MCARVCARWSPAPPCSEEDRRRPGTARVGAPRLQAFANGYCFGELLNAWELQPDFEKFDAGTDPKAAVNNFKRLQVTRAPQRRTAPPRTGGVAAPG